MKKKKIIIIRIDKLRETNNCFKNLTFIYLDPPTCFYQQMDLSLFQISYLL